MNRSVHTSRVGARRSGWGGVWLMLVLALTTCENPPPSVTGVVAAASPEAAQAGVEILDAGGNAIDAVVAVQFALAVTEPAMSGLGGQTQILVHRPGEEPFVINGTSYSPSATPVGATTGDIDGHRATTIPATVKSLDFAWRTYGSGAVSWADLLASAIRYADSGFVVGPFRHRVWRRHREELAANPATAALFLGSNGNVPGEGDTFRQPRLAATLRRLAEAGADDFYTGEIARQIAADMEANGGWITGQDLANVADPTVIPALRTTYRGFDVATLPPPGGGWVVLQLLNLLELTEQDRLRSDPELHVTTLAEALRIGHTSRQSNPIPDLVNYQTAAADRISKETARALWEARSRVRVSVVTETVPSRGETTHFSVVDGDGVAVSVTASINAYFGARAASPALGFLYNDYMHEFELGQPQHPFALRPNAMPYSSMSPTIVGQSGKPVLALGSPGSARIISTVAQVTHRWIDLEETVGQAVTAPRIHVVPDDRLYLEPGATTETSPAWVADHDFRVVEPSIDLMLGGRNAYFGGVHAVALEGGVWVGSADPRRDGAVRYAGGARRR